MIQEQGECTLFGFYSYIVQLTLAVIAILVLTGKYIRIFK
jgi:hypothetical protein